MLRSRFLRLGVALLLLADLPRVLQLGEEHPPVVGEEGGEDDDDQRSDADDQGQQRVNLRELIPEDARQKPDPRHQCGEEGRSAEVLVCGLGLSALVGNRASVPSEALRHAELPNGERRQQYADGNEEDVHVSPW